MNHPFPGRPFPRIVPYLPEELRAPRFVREMGDNQDIAAMAYWSGAIAQLKAAILTGDLDRIEAVMQKIRDDGHADEVTQLLEHKARVAEYLAGTDEITVGIIILDDESGE